MKKSRHAYGPLRLHSISSVHAPTLTAIGHSTGVDGCMLGLVRSAMTFKKSKLSADATAKNIFV
jgi:hypothetical protein